MWKKIFTAIVGVVFTTVNACNLFVCMVSGITPLAEEEIAFYMAKAGFFSFLFPGCLYGFCVMAWHYMKLYKQMAEKVDDLETQLELYKIVLANKKNKGKKGPKREDVSVPQLSAALEKGKLSEEEVKELLELLEEL